MISLVMATYNGEQFIVEQLDSIRIQTLLPDEVLIFDDCSVDNTVSIVENYIKENSLHNWKIKKNTENKGYSLNFSDAMKVAKGDIIFLADQDDIWLPDKIEKMAKVMFENSSIELLASNVKPFYAGLRPQKVNFEKFSKRHELVKISGLRRWIKPSRPGCSMCIRSTLLENYHSLWFEEYPHDCLLWGLAVINKGAYIYNRYTIKFRRHESNVSSRGGHRKDYRVKEIKKEIKMITRMIEFVNKSGNKENVIFLKGQLETYKKRGKILEQRNFFGAILMLSNLKYYGRSRFWLTDLFYCLKE